MPLTVAKALALSDFFATFLSKRFLRCDCVTEYSLMETTHYRWCYNDRFKVFHEPSVVAENYAQTELNGVCLNESDV